MDHPQTLSQPQLLLLTWLSISLVLLVVLGRVGVRFQSHGRPLVDDYFLILAMALTISMGIAHTLSMDPLFALRKDEEPQPSTLILFFKVQFAARIIFWVNFYAVKASILAFLRSFLHALPSSSKYWYTAVAFVFLGAAGSVVGNMTECTPIWRNFSLTESCSGPDYLQTSRIILTSLTAWDILTDLMIIILPLPLLFSMRRLLTKCQLVSLFPVFGSGILVVIFAILRLERIWHNRPIEDLPWQITIAMTWSQVEASVAVLVGALPAFKVLFTRQLINSYDRPHGKGQIGTLRPWIDTATLSEPSTITTETTAKSGKSVSVNVTKA